MMLVQFSYVNLVSVPVLLMKTNDTMSTSVFLKQQIKTNQTKIRSTWCDGTNFTMSRQGGESGTNSLVQAARKLT